MKNIFCQKKNSFIFEEHYFIFSVKFIFKKYHLSRKIHLAQIFFLRKMTLPFLNNFLNCFSNINSKKITLLEK